MRPTHGTIPSGPARPAPPARPALPALLLACCVALAACADSTAPLELSEVQLAKGGNGNGKGGGGGGDGGSGSPPISDELDPWDPALWIPQEHTLGRSWLDADNVSQGPGTLLLTIPAGTIEGAEILSAERHRYRAVEARLRTPDVPGSLSAFFFYEGVPRRNDEIDIEILNDGSREIWFTTWVNGRRTNHAVHVLPFDPTSGFHDYRIEWSAGLVRFLVDDSLYQEWTSGVPKDAMFVMSNLWWPTWLSGPTLGTDRSLEIDRIEY